jgi:hypothetical protein
MVGALFAVLVIGVGLGLLERLMLPGRHGLLKVLWRDLTLLPRMAIGAVPGRLGFARILMRDVELRWETGASLIGAYGGYFVGRAFDHTTGGPPSVLRWTLCIVGAAIFGAIAMASGVIERTAITRQLGIHRTHESVR